jgi:thiol-disulfide isomerase/thioredoxin
MNLALPVFSLLLSVSNLLFAQTDAPKAQAKEFTDPVALLQEVAKNYASGADTFRLEAIEENEKHGELEHEWTKVYRTAIKGPGTLYRIETRSRYASVLQVSDGVNEWVYLAEAKVYVKRPLPLDWPQFSKMMTVGNMELRNAWEMRTWLESAAAGYKHATMLPEETITVEGKKFPCYVVYATSDDEDRTPDKESHWSHTYWIDKAALIFRKQVKQEDSYLMMTQSIHLPMHSHSTTVYPVVDFNPQISTESFQFTPPADAKEVKTLEPDFGPLPSNQPKTQWTGKLSPSVTLTDSDGKKVELSSYRGKPVLLDFWATWCGSCLLSMPAMHRIDVEAKDKNLIVVTVDQDHRAEDATAYLERHRYGWKNYHDSDGSAAKAFNGGGIPFTVLIDSTGKVVYESVGSDEVGLRKAIAALGPEFASLAVAGAQP